MRRIALAIALFLPGSALAQESFAADLNFLIGQKQLDRDDWGDDLDRQLITGAETTWRKRGWRVGVAADAMFANKEKRRGTFAEEEVTRGSTLELAVGVRAIVPFGRWRPHAGAGIELAQADRQVLRRQEADDAAGAGGTGWWASGGVFARLGRTANLGLSVRWSSARVKSGSFDGEAGGMVYGVTLGFGIPPYESDGPAPQGSEVVSE